MSTTNLQVNRLTDTGWVSNGNVTASGTPSPTLFAPTLTYDQVGAEATGIARAAQTWSSHAAFAAAGGSVTGSSSQPVFACANNTTYNNMDFFGRVSVSGPGVAFNNCRFRGYLVNPWVSESTLGLLHLSNSAASGVVATDCTFIPDYPSIDWDAVLGHDFTLLRCLIAHCNDGFGMQNTSNPTANAHILIDTCYVNWLSFWTPEPAGTTPNSDAKTHNDCMQIASGLSGIVLRNSSFNGLLSMPVGMGVLDDPFGYVGVGGTDPSTIPNASDGTVANNPYYPAPSSNSCIQTNVGVACNIDADGCFFDGGSSSLNLAGTLAGLRLTNCYFGHNQRQAGTGAGYGTAYLGRVRPSTDPLYNDTATVINTSGKGYTITNNIYWDNKVPIHVR